MDQLGVFAKHWQPGKVKTRIAADVGNDHAAELYRMFLLRTLRNLQSFEGKRVLAYSPVDRITAFEGLVQRGDWQLEAQADGDLGTRMSAYFRRAFESEAEKVALIGSDSPNLPPDRIHAAFRALDSSDLVLGPSDDGGYYLIGMRRFLPEVFESIEWSTGKVYSQTICAAQQCGIRCESLASWYDIDDIDDLERLLRALQNSDNDRQLAQLVADVLSNAGSLAGRIPSVRKAERSGDQSTGDG